MNSRFQISVPPHRLKAFCEKWQIQQLALFGSVLRPDFRADSDVDVLVTFAPDAQPGWIGKQQMRDELRALFGRPVDLVDRQAVVSDPNYLRRQQILESAEVLHGS